MIVPMSFQAWFFSDIHLKSADEPNARLLADFLHGLDQSTTHVFFMGDVFDLWVGDHQYFADKFKPIVDQVHRLVGMGVEVHVFEGNHDFHLSGFWQDKAGALVHPDPVELKLGAFKFRLSHGDETNPQDKAYQRLRRVLRSEFARKVIHGSPSWLVAKIGESWSAHSAEKRKPYVDPVVRKITHDYAREQAEKTQYDFMIFGHTHMRDDVRLDTDKHQARFINLGTWLDVPAVLRVTDKEAEFVHLT